MNNSAITNLTGSRLRRLGFESIWIVIGQALAALGGIIGVRLLTGVLNPVIYGQLALAMTIITLIQYTLLSPLGATFTRFFAPSREMLQLPGFLRGAQRMLGEVTSVILGAAVITGLVMLIRGQIDWLGLLIAGTAFSLFSGYSIAMDGMQNAARQRIVVAWHKGLRVWLQFLLAVLMVNQLGATGTATMIGYALSAFVVFLSQYFFFKSKILAISHKQPAVPNEIFVKIIRQMRTYVWPLMTWGVFIWLRTAADRWALQAFGTTYEVGLFEVLFQLGFYPISLGLELVLQLMTPILFEIAGDATDLNRLIQARQLNQAVFILALVLTGIGMFLGFLFHDFVFAVFAAPEYGQVSTYLPWMILSAGIFISTRIAGQLVAICLQTKRLLAPQIITGIIGVIASFLAAYLWGLQGIIATGITVATLRLIWVLMVRSNVFRSTLLQLAK